MEHVNSFTADLTTISRSQALAPRRASAWRPEAYRQASPELAAVIAAALAAHRSYKKAREEGRRMREARPHWDVPSDKAVREAAGRVEVPAILRVPHTDRQLASVVYSDGHTIDFPPETHRTLKGNELEDHFGDAETLAQARKAYRGWQRAVNKAMGALFAASKPPGHTEAEAACDAWFRSETAPRCDEWEAAKAVLRSFKAVTPEDRLAQALALFEMEGGKITRTGEVHNAEDAFANDGYDEGERLATLMFAALAASVDESSRVSAAAPAPAVENTSGCPAAGLAAELENTYAEELQADERGAEDEAIEISGRRGELTIQISEVAATSLQGAALQLALAMERCEMVRGCAQVEDRDYHHDVFERLMRSALTVLAPRISENVWTGYVGGDHPNATTEAGPGFAFLTAEDRKALAKPLPQLMAAE